ncbi:MAG TPA: reverse transcriptase/maturase family protein [Myxococcota bacterium]|nr:reverse transcriptase/maturase family protein [Myxococcota bacterium]HPB51818.1 reverse transcriptase/maturase family protein [Myxococcota bacterium]
MNRVGRIFQEVTDFNHLCESAKRAAIGTRNYDSLRFMFDLEREVLKLQDELTSGAYVPGDYRTFQVREPKLRTISASPFRDRVVHHALCAVLEPTFERFLIPDCFACRVGKGTVAAIRRAQYFTRRHERYAKLDVRHFFETADHGVLKMIVRRLVKDRAALRLIDQFINKGAPGSLPGKGVPIGNLTSQNFANIYLGPFDHHMKEVVGIPGYVRYMDDILLFGDDRTFIRDAVSAADRFLAGLKLELKTEVCRRGRVADGVSFLGFNVFPSVIRFDAPRRRRFAQKVADVRRRLEAGAISEGQAVAILDSVYGWTGVGDTAAYTRDISRANFFDV